MINEYLDHAFKGLLFPRNTYIKIDLSYSITVMLKRMTGWQKLPLQEMCRSYNKYNANRTKNVAYYMTTGLCLVRATCKKILCLSWEKVEFRTHKSLPYLFVTVQNIVPVCFHEAKKGGSVFYKWVMMLTFKFKYYPL